MNETQNPTIESTLNRAKTLHAHGQIAEAEQAYLEVLKLQPRNLDALFNLGNLFAMVNHFEGATAWFDKVLFLNPHHLGALSAQAMMQDAQGRPREAEQLFRRAVQITPQDPSLLNHLGLSLFHQYRLDEGLAEMSKALVLDPNHRDALLNSAVILTSLGRFDEAGTLIKNALEAHPDDPYAQWTQGCDRLRHGDFKQGWEGLEARLRAELPPHLLVPEKVFRWDGAVRPGLKLLVRIEQSFGDTLQFIRCVKNLRQQGVDMVLEVTRSQVPLVSLLQAQAWIPPMVGNADDVRDRTAAVNLMSLPLAMGWTQEQTIQQKSREPYLAPDPDVAKAWGARLSDLPGKKIGLIWSGAPLHPLDAERNLPVHVLRPLWDLPGVMWTSLQKDLKHQPSHSELPVGHWVDFTTGLDDLHHVAGLIANLDAVVTVDTELAHMAGAMGIPVFLMLPRGPEWRWMLDRNDTPWYPKHRIFRQPEPGDWASVVQDVKAALTEFLAK